MKFEWFPASLAFYLFSTSCVHADALIRVKVDKRAANGICVPNLKENFDAVLLRNRVSLVREDGERVEVPIKEALARIIRTMEGISLGTFKYHNDVKLVIMSKWGYSWHVRGTDEIFISPGAESSLHVKSKTLGGTNNYGMLAHELAHFVSMRDKEAVQKSYDDFVVIPCNVTKYTSVNRAEEFAEVFSAFLTNPDLLNNDTVSCEKAKQFMSRLFRENPKKASNCESRSKSLE